MSDGMIPTRRCTSYTGQCTAQSDARIAESCAKFSSEPPISISARPPVPQLFPLCRRNIQRWHKDFIDGCDSFVRIMEIVNKPEFIDYEILLFENLR